MSAPTVPAPAAAAPSSDRGTTGLRRFLAGGTGPVLILLVAILATIIIVNPTFGEPAALMVQLKKAAPWVLLALGQYFVIVVGEFDLSMGALVGAQAAIAAKLIDKDDALTYPVMLLMLVFALVIGLVNGIVTTVLKVPSFIATLAMMLILSGAVFLWTGGRSVGGLSTEFRKWGRLGIEMPGINILPWAVLIALALAVGGVMLMRSSYGRTLLAVGDSSRAASFSGVRVNWIKTSAFLLSAVLATVAAILRAGETSATVDLDIGAGLEFTAITAVVLGGVMLGGGRGSAIAAMLGALVLFFLEPLFRALELDPELRPAVQGAILILAVAYAARTPGFGRRRGTPRTPPT